MNRSVHRACLVAAAAACLLIAGPAVFAQEIGGSVEGTVTGPDGEVLPGVSVTIRGTGLPGGRTVTTNDSGGYRLPTVPPGRYVIAAQLEGFQAVETPEFRVSLASQLTVDVPMRLDVGEEIMVTSDVPLISISASDTSAVISNEWIEKLPVGRDFADVVTQAGGTDYQPDKSGGYSVDGSSGSENTWIIDGIDTTSLQTGEQGQLLNTDFVEEVQIKSGGYMPEFRASTGGVINAVTKTGGNEFAGDVHAYYEDDGLYSDPRPEPERGQTGNTGGLVTYREDGYERFEPGFTLGGPVVRDRLWFFVGYSPFTSETDRFVEFTDGTEDPNGNLLVTDSGRFSMEAGRDYTVANLSGSAGTLYYRLGFSADDYDRDRTLPTSLKSLPTRPNTSSPDPEDYDVDREAPGRIYSGHLDWLPTDRLQATLRGGHFEYDNQDVGFYTGPRLSFSGLGTPCDQFPGQCIPSLNRPIGSLTPLNTGIDHDLFERDYLQPEMTFFLDDVGGDHEIKVGYLNEEISNDVLNGYTNTRIIYYWDDNVTDLEGQTRRGPYGVYRVFQIATQGEVTANNQSIFLQDSWRPIDRLTVNLGVRADKEEVPSYSVDPRVPDPAIDFDYDDKIAPRLGFAYDVLGDGRWKAYGSYGVFYDTIKLEMARGLFGGDKWVDWWYGLDTFDWQSIADSCRVQEPNAITVPPVGCPGEFLFLVDQRHPANDPDDPTIEPNLKPMESNEITLGAEHLFRDNMVFGARYVRKRLERTIEDVGVNVPGVGTVYTISNPGEGVARQILGPEFPAMPRPKREYDALTLSLRKNFSNHWGLNLSYTYSKLYGNYSGLASSDEDGRNSPNVNRFFDGLPMLFDSRGRTVEGRLHSDRPHVFKGQLIYELPWGTVVGVDQFAGSGIPESTVMNAPGGLPFFPYGRGNMGRMDTLTQTDLSLTHPFRLGGRIGLEISLEVFNLFDEDAMTDIWELPYQGSLALSDEQFFAGFDPDVVAKGDPTTDEDDLTVDPLYRVPEEFQGPRTARFGVKITF